MIVRAYAVILAALAVAACGRDPTDIRREPPGLVERVFTPAPVPLSAAAIARGQALVRKAVEREAFPGAVLVAGNRDSIQSMTAFGRVRWEEDAPPADVRATLYDLSSLTKVVATTAAVMALVEDRRLQLDAPISRYLPDFAGGDKGQVTIRQILTHTSGIRAGLVEIPDATPAELRRHLLSIPLTLPPGQDVLYSDLGFVVLWMAAEAAAGEPLQSYLLRRIWGPLGMTSTTVGVPLGCEPCAPTLHLEERDEPYSGGSFDELARRLEGVAGNAGAFSTAADLAHFAGMIANEGRLGDVRVLSKRTVRAFTRAQPGAGTRALGWEVYCREGVVPDHEACAEVLAFGHTGVTGTSLWIDPERRGWVVLLTNRSYLPRADTEMQSLRRELFRTVTGTGTAGG